MKNREVHDMAVQLPGSQHGVREMGMFGRTGKGLRFTGQTPELRTGTAVLADDRGRQIAAGAELNPGGGGAQRKAQSGFGAGYRGAVSQPALPGGAKRQIVVMPQAACRTLVRAWRR
jgi:hypothetical protein